ncbi:hypothetical protein ACHAWF_016156 [Thalassiosira exigua]
MLSGIKTGKRKRQRPPTGAAAPPPPPPASGDGPSAAGGGNRSAAEALRLGLLRGGGPVRDDGGDGEGGGRGGGGATSSRVRSRLDAPRASSSRGGRDEAAIRGLEDRGRISAAAVPAAPRDDDDDDAVVIRGPGKRIDVIEYERERKVRFNARGKLSRRAHEQLRQSTDREATVEEMAAAERRDPSGGMDEAYARNVLKMGKGYKKLEKAMGTSRSGADEDDYLQETAGLSDLYRSRDDKYSPAALAARDRSRQIAQHDAVAKWTAKSWWWMESPKFEKRYLIALGERTSLVMTAAHRRLRQDAKRGGWDGGQCSIVPLPYSESFVGLDEEVWREVARFQSSLRRMFRKEGRGVLFLETVTRTSRGGGGAALQAKMDVVPVPRSVERDTPLFFKSALAEVAQEWGTHGTKPISLNETKTLRNAVPKGFPYFYVGWEEGGFVQLIENEDDGEDEDGGGGLRAGGGSKRFPRDFGIDTIGGMMDCDPIRFQRRSHSQDGDRGAILQFCEKWKEFDWTLELDG